MEYYKKDTNPLESILEEDIKLGELIYDNFGRCFKKIMVNDKSLLVQQKKSVLVDDCLLTDLENKTALNLFWTLSKNAKDGNKFKSE